MEKVLFHLGLVTSIAVILGFCIKLSFGNLIGIDPINFITFILFSLTCYTGAGAARYLKI